MLLLVASTTTIAHADGRAAAARAQAAAADGAVAFGAGAYERALADYQRAYMDDIDEPQYLLRLAECYRAMQRTPEALRFYKLFLHERPDAPERASLEATIGELEHPAAAATTTATVAAEGSAARDGRRPIWRRWWFWTALGGAAAVGVGLGVGLGARGGGASFSPTLPAFGPGGQSLTVSH